MAAKKFADAVSRESFWGEHVARWSSSGQSILGYCRAQGLSEGCFHYWKNALKRRGAQSAAGDGPPVFAELKLVGTREACIEVRVGDAHRVHVHPGFDADTLRRVLAVLERAGC
ncbi:MAG: hypothetical protein KA184_01400 [Candidatus Hydrogenedentes bacterium]|nr:hypothetical protein [Candidatus Hydrogenedentota bacterium]